VRVRTHVGYGMAVANRGELYGPSRPYGPSVTSWLLGNH
jgi:hypothetical protein